MGIHILDPVPLLLDKDHPRPILGDIFLSRDTHHVSMDGALAVKDIFRPFFKNML